MLCWCLNVYNRWRRAQVLEKEYSRNKEDTIWKFDWDLKYWIEFLDIPDKMLDGFGVDVGCGHHGIYTFLPDNMVGIDPISFDDRKNFVVGVAEYLPFRKVSFVISCNGIDHYLNPQEAISEMFRISDRVIIWVYIYPKWLAVIMSKLDKMHSYHLTEKEVFSYLFGYTITHQKYYYPIKHWKLTQDLFSRVKLVIAYLAGVRGLCIHLEH